MQDRGHPHRAAMMKATRGELEWVRVDCPYCGESFETALDASGGARSYVEDCAVCCRPIVFVLALDALGNVSVQTWREHD
jgi:hypothetical protein